MRTINLVLLLTVQILILNNLNSGILFAQSFRIYPTNNSYQYEPTIEVSPLDPLVMFCSANTYFGGQFFSEGVYVTTNGGLNWVGDDTCTGSPIINHGGDPGIAIDKNGIFILKHIGNPIQQQGVFTHYSTNMGSTWSNQSIVIQQQSPEDKGSLATDNIPTSPYYGRSYVTGVNYVPPYPVLFAYSTNSGASWSSYSSIINGTPLKRCSGGELGIGPNGQVYDVWAGDSSTIVPSVEQIAGFGVSTNGGVNWYVTQQIFTMHGIGGLMSTPGGNILVNGIPRIAVDLSSGPRKGWIYIVTNEINNSPAGSDPDIVFHRSTDGDTTWSQGIRVNQDPLNNGKRQFFPAICVDSTGGIDIIYYDNRNTTSDSSQVYLSRSTNGGTNWLDYQISDKTFQPKPIPYLNQKMGDFISITSARNKLFIVWMADYTGAGSFQIWINISDINAIGIKQISSQVPEHYVLKQNYPNPFNPSTNIEFSVPNKNFVKLTIYNSLGEKISTLVNSELEAGSYRTEFNGANFGSGIYFYQIQSGDFVQAKKMILVK